MNIQELNVSSEVGRFKKNNKTSEKVRSESGVVETNMKKVETHENNEIQDLKDRLSAIGVGIKRDNQELMEIVVWLDGILLKL